MEWKTLLIDSYGPALKTVDRVLDGLSQEDLSWQPHPECNSISWTIWHLARVLDKLVSSITGEEQIWVKDKWCAKFNRLPDPNDTGLYHTPEQVIAFECPDIGILSNYHQSVAERMKQCLDNLSSSDLDREVNDEWSKWFPTIASRLVVAFDELAEHAGQVGYIRGLRQGKGWQEF